eukprot:TRINITY_DN9836_c0_g1_i1.p1 TRINITY_DN9836_c0_g1~~TRINITY_DN9836_c0_g1_i1.p1  ORF type:complete len:852 (+),score=285.08 TRINITY_DN9836_c0_g1_i1:106-2661(+)
MMQPAGPGPGGPPSAVGDAVWNPPESPQGDAMARLVDAFAAVTTSSGEDRARGLSELMSIVGAHSQSAALSPPRHQHPPGPSPQPSPGAGWDGMGPGGQPRVESDGLSPRGPQALSAWDAEAGTAGDGMGSADAPSSFYERSMLWRQRQKEAVDRMRARNASKETEGCTWRPRVNALPGAERRGGVGRGAHELPVQERLRIASEQAKSRRESRQARRLREEAADCPFRPNVNARGSPRANAGRACDRLYRQGMERKGLLLGDEGEILYATGQAPDALDLTGEDIRLLECELRDIEALAATSRVRRHLRHQGPPAGDHPALADDRFLRGDVGVAVGGRLVASNYRDSDGEPDPEAEPPSAGERRESDLARFLMRQNDHEDRRLRKLEHLEACTAPRLRPMLSVRSRRLWSAGAASRLQHSHADPGALGGSKKRAADSGLLSRQEERVHKLCCAVASQRCELRNLQQQCQVLLRHIAKINAQLPPDEAVLRDSGPVAQLQADLAVLQKWRQCDGDGVVHIGGDALHTRPAAAELADAADPGQAATFGASVAKQCAAAAAALFSSRRKQLVTAHRGEWVPKYSAQISSWLRDLLRAQEGLAQLVRRTAKIQGALSVEKEKALAGAALRWEAIAEMELGRPPCTQKDLAQLREERAELIGGTDPPPQGDPLPQLQKGDRLKVRRNHRDSKWLHATFHHYDDAGAKLFVVEHGKTAPCPKPYPASRLFVQVIPPPESMLVLSPRARSGARESSSLYNEKALRGCSRDGLSEYSRSLLNRRQEEDDRRRKAAAMRLQQEQEQCTHAPRVRPAPAYITRIAHSMALLRGEKESRDGKGRPPAASADLSVPTVARRSSA